MASLDENGDKVNTLNLGDSGYIILRPDATKDSGFETVFRTKE